MDYLLEGVGGLNQINISDLDKNEIIKWKLIFFLILFLIAILWPAPYPTLLFE